MLRTEFISGGSPAKIGAFGGEVVDAGVIGAPNRRDRRRIGHGKAAGGGLPAGYGVMAKVFFPDRERLTTLGYETLAHVPSIFDSKGRLCRIEGRYLRDRATGDWWPEGGKPELRERTIANFADTLVNFIAWCEELGGVDRTTATYADVLRYQRDQIAGRWSYNGEGLDVTTANKRADEVTNFLTWAAQTELRGPFPVKRFFAEGPSSKGKHRAKARAGRAKENDTTQTEKSFILPKPEAIKEWLKQVIKQKGYAKHLACRFILETGARRMEVELLEVDQWPMEDAIAEAAEAEQQTVSMDLFETKGGKPRIIWVPLSFALRVRKWIDGRRVTYARRYYKHNAGKRTSRLFLSDHPDAHGQPLSAQTIYRTFTDVTPRPKGWSPHKGRHCFACFYVLNAITADAGPKGLEAKGADWIWDRGAVWLAFLRKQFGHVSENTTQLYLRWLIQATSLADMAMGWHHFLEADGGLDLENE